MRKSTLELFAAMQLKYVRRRCEDLGYQFITHLIKCFIFKNSGHKDHWISEIQTWLDEVNRLKSKGGKIKYNYIFELYDPFDEKQVKGWIETLKYKYPDLKEEFYRVKEVTDYLNYIDNVMSNRKTIISIENMKSIIDESLNIFAR